MTAVHIILPAKPSTHSVEFGTYNEALEHARKMASLNPSKPFKRIKGASCPVWSVSFVNVSAIKTKPQSIRFETVPGYTGIPPIRGLPNS